MKVGDRVDIYSLLLPLSAAPGSGRGDSRRPQPRQPRPRAHSAPPPPSPLDSPTGLGSAVSKGQLQRTCENVPWVHQEPSQKQHHIAPHSRRCWENRERLGRQLIPAALAFLPRVRPPADTRLDRESSAIGRRPTWRGAHVGWSGQ